MISTDPIDSKGEHFPEDTTAANADKELGENLYNICLLYRDTSRQHMFSLKGPRSSKMETSTSKIRGSAKQKVFTIKRDSLYKVHPGSIHGSI